MKKQAKKILKWFCFFLFFFVIFLLIPKTIKDPDVRGWAKPLTIFTDNPSQEENNNPTEENLKPE